jgi:hypothetical protein
MTQDPYGRPPGSGYVVRGEIVPDDEANVTPPTTPMTHFQKVASALRGDRTDSAPDSAPSEQAADPTSPQVPDPNGTWPGANQAAAATIPDAEDAADAQDAAGGEHDADATRPEEVVAVRSPDAGDRDEWWDADETGPEVTAATSPDVSAAGVAGADPGPDAGPDEPAGVAEVAEAADQTRPDVQDPTLIQPTAGAGAAEPETLEQQADIPAQEGLRPGESDRALGDFSDLTYGSLLPDATEFKARWQQVQFRFVDDPQGSVTDAADVISQLTARLEAAIQERQRAIAERQHALRDRWSEGKSADTESLRETLLMYRTFLDQLTGPKIS